MKIDNFFNFNVFRIYFIKLLKIKNTLKIIHLLSQKKNTYIIFILIIIWIINNFSFSLYSLN